MIRQQKDQSILQLFVSRQTGSSDGSLLANKEFYLAYYILNHNFNNMTKRIMGILYNHFDKQHLYFQCYVPISEDFNLAWLLENVIYNKSKPYSSYATRQVLLSDDTKKNILNQCEKAISDKIAK